MTIAYLTSEYPAPSHVFIRREIKALRATGIKIDTFSVRPPALKNRQSPEDKADFEATYYLLPDGGKAKAIRALRANICMGLSNPVGYFQTLALALKHRGPGVKTFTMAFVYFLEAMILSYELKRRNISHVHNHFANASATVSFLATRFLGIKYSLTLHAHSETDYPAGLTLGAKIEAADFVMCISHFMRAQAFRTVGRKHHDKIHIYRCGVPVAKMSLPVQQTVEKDRFRFISVARLSEEKGHYGLIKAFANIVLSHSHRKLELVLVGDGPEKQNLQDLVSELGLSEMVKFRGALPEGLTQGEIMLADALVLGSFMEGIPVVLMEAMSLGKPVIAPHITGIPELISHQVDGLLFTPTDWNDLSLKMTQLIEGEYQDLGWYGNRALISKGFEINKAVQPLIEMFLKSR